MEKASVSGARGRHPCTTRCCLKALSFLVSYCWTNQMWPERWVLGDGSLQKLHCDRRGQGSSRRGGSAGQQIVQEFTASPVEGQPRQRLELLKSLHGKDQHEFGLGEPV